MHIKLVYCIPFLFILYGYLTPNDIGNQKAFYECTEPQKIDSSLFEVKKGKTYFQFNTSLKPTNLHSKGFIWLEDQPENYFTAYLINTSDSVFHAIRQDKSLLIIQEAINTKGMWKPIEYWVLSGCGNSYHPFQLDSGNYVMIPIKQYKGSFKTKFRLKMKQGQTIFYSDSFDGSLERTQFQKQTQNIHGILYHGPANYFD